MGNMMKKKFGKSVLLACMLVVALLSTSISALAYDITNGDQGFDLDISESPTDVKTLSVKVEGAGTNQITIVVRKDNNDWLTAPNSNVLFIDQVTGAGATTNLTMSFDPEKWTMSKGTYKIFVGGSGQDVKEALLRVGTDILLKPANPTGAVAGAVYGAPVEITFTSGTSADYTDSLQVESKATAGGTYAIEGTYAGSNGKHTVQNDGFYKVTTKRVSTDLSDTQFSTSSLEFRIDSASVSTLYNDIDSIIMNGAATATVAQIASIKTTVPTAYNALSSYQKTAFEELAGTTFAALQSDLNDIRTARFEADLTASAVYGLIDALPTVAAIGDMDETEKEAVIADVEAIDAAITALAAPYVTAGDTTATSGFTTITNAYDSGKLPAVKDALDIKDIEIDNILVGEDPAKPGVPLGNFDVENHTIVTFNLPAGTDTTTNMTIGGAQVYYSPERDLYFALIPDTSIIDGVLNMVDVVKSDGTIPHFNYCDFDGSGEHMPVDITNTGKYYESGNPSPASIFSVDSNGDGKFMPVDITNAAKYYESGSLPILD